MTGVYAASRPERTSSREEQLLAKVTLKGVRSGRKDPDGVPIRSLHPKLRPGAIGTRLRSLAERLEAELMTVDPWNAQRLWWW